MHDDGYVCRRGQELLQDLSGRPRKIQAEETWRAPSQASLTGRTCCGRAAGAAGGPAGVSAREVKHPLCRISEPGQRRQDPRGPSTRACPGTAVSTNLAFGAVEYAVPVRIAPPTARARRSRAGREGALTPVREAKAGWGQGQRPLAGALHTRVRNGTFRSSRRMPPLARAWLALACAAAAAATLVGAAGPAEHGALGAPSPPLPLPGVSAAAAVRRAGRHALLWAAAGGPERRAEPRGGGRAGAAAAVASAKHLGGIAADEQQPRLQSRGWALACPPALDVGLWASGGWLLLLLLLGAAGLPVGAAAHGRPRRSRAAAAGRRLGERRGRFRRCAEAAAAVAAVGCVALLPLMVHAQQSCPAGQDLSGSCLCNGATGSTGGGTDCLSLQGGLAWCYTDENACSDGTDSAQLASTEWSFAACTAAGACADCPAGRYKSTAGTAACIDCAAGKYIDVAGIDSSGDCINCAAGRYGAGGLTSSQCSGDCDAGRYSLAGTSAGPAGSDCIGCDAGRYGAGGSTTSQCSGACDAGRYSTASTSAGPAGSDCIPCAGGRYVSARGSDELSDCIDCAVGKYTVAAARTACISCAAGRYAAQQATTAHGAHDLRCGTPHGCSADDESARHDTDSAPHAVGCCSDNAPGSPMPAPVESFEQSSWTTAGVVAQNAASQNTWTRRYVVTPPTNTGPASTLGAYGGNYYLYTEASNNFNEDFILDIVPVLAANTGYTLGFWYHMHGGDTGTLSVEIADQGSATWAVRWFKTGEQQAAASDPWLQSLVRLTPTVDSTVRVKGVTGAGHESDMCIDAVQLSMGGSTPSVGWQAPRTETNAQQGLHSFCTVRAQKNEAPAADSVTRAHSEAVAYCTDRGARLCTALELEAGCLSGRTAVANQMVWSSSQTGCTGCEVGKYSAAVGSSAASACKHCDAGKYTNLRGSASCASCPVGRYDGTTGTEYCIECATGMYNAMIMITTCIACPAGELSDPVYSDYQAVLATATLGSTNAGAGACVATNACPAGKYAAKSNAGGYCNACPAGRYTATAGSTDVAGCILCAVGKYNTRFAQTSEDACVDCSPGKYVTVAGSDEASDCIACAAGKYVGTDDSCTVVGMVDCFGSCVPGCAAFNGATWNDEPSDCVDCAAGKYSSVSGSISVDDCTDCIAGKYGAVVGSADCIDCEVGKYVDVTGSDQMSDCIDCVAGKYIDVAGGDDASDCIACAVGKHVPVAHATQLEGNCSLIDSGLVECNGVCVPGLCMLGECVNDEPGDCIDCAAGQFSPTPGATVCGDCVVGRYIDVSGSDAVTDCIACVAGKYIDASGSGHCINCVAGKYIDATGSSQTSDCIDCVAGKYSDVAGSDAVTDCIDCVAAKYITLAGSDHASDCIDCAAGQYGSIPGATGCNDCEAGKFNAVPAVTDCASCAVGRYTGVVGSDAETDCIDCPTGRYGLSSWRDVRTMVQISPGATYRRWHNTQPSPLQELLGITAAPNVESVITAVFQSPSNVCDYCATEMVAFFRTPQAGSHVFKVAGNSLAHLYFGETQAEAEGRAPIASVPEWTSARQWNKYPGQTSAPQILMSDTSYFIKAIAKEGTGSDHLAVAVELPDGAQLAPIPVFRPADNFQYLRTGSPAAHSWTCLFRQTAPNYKPLQDWLRFSPDDRSGDFSILDELEASRQPDGKFSLKLVWPQRMGDNTQTWRQTTNPVTQSQRNGGVIGYERIDVHFTAAGWGGLEKGGADSLLDGTVGHSNWFYAVGSSVAKNGGIPGPGTVETQVELWTVATAAAVCADCPSGKYVPGIGSVAATACIDCRLGKYVTVAGSDEVSDCIACAAGKYVRVDDSCTVVGMVDCFGSCVPGCGVWNDEPSDCVDCAAGKYSSVSGSISVDDCTDCIAGKYGAVVGSADCIDCEVGKYVDVTGSDQMSDCIDCVAGKYIDVTGGDDASDCIACAVGKYANAPGGDVESDCISCPDVKRTTKLPGSNQALDCVCKDGYYESVAVAGVCDACTPVQDSTRGTRLWCTSATNSRIDECAIGYIRFVAGVPPNSGTADICDSDSPEARVAIVSSIDENLQDPSFISGLQSSPEVLTSYVRALESATSMGGQFTLAADAVDSAFGSMETLSTLPLSSSAADGLGSGVSNLLDRSTEIYAGGAAGSSDDAAATDQAKNRAGVVSGVLQRVALSKASADRSLGLDRSDLNTDMFQLAAHFPASVVGSTLSAGASSVALPPSGLGQDAQTVQTVQWSGAGPHFWAGSALSEELLEDTVLGSKVLTVNFFNGIGIGLNIVNLSQPVLVSLTVPAASARGIKPGRNQTVKCGYWDGAIDAWVADVDAVVISESEIGCSVTHFTDWAAFIGPPPKVNELGKLRDITKNPVGLVISLSMLAVSLIAGCYGVIDYRRFARRAAAPDGDALRKRYEDDAGGFAMHSARLLDTDIPWSSRAVIQLRRGWLGGSIFCPLRGDPWLRSQRLFTVLVQILLSLLGAAMFFQSEDELLEGICEGQAAGWDQLQSDDWCTSTRGTPAPCCEEENAILASLLTAACALPVIGAVNIAFGCLRQPLEADAMSKSGEQMSKLQESKISGYDNSTAKRRKRRGHGRSLKRLKRWGTSCKKCVVVQYQCCAQRLHKDSVDVREEDNSDTEITAVKSTGSLPLQQAPRARAPVCPRRKLVAGQMRTCAATIDYLFDRVDLDHSNTLDMEELRNLMSEISQGAVVREDDLLFVMQHAQRGSDDTGTIARSEVKQAISLWRYLQHERAFIADRFDEFDADNNGKLSRMELNAMMTSLNDGISVTEKEVDWVLRAGNPSVDVSDKTRGGLDADEARGALAMW